VRRLLASAVIAALLTGCAVGPKYEGTGVQAPANWTDAGAATEVAKPTASVVAEPRAWWRDLGDPTLDRLIERAAEQNFDLQRARARVLEARAGQVVTASRLYPEVTAGARGARQSTQPLGQEQTVSLFEATFDAAWEIDLFGANRSRADAAGALAQGARFQADAVLLSLRAEVARNYIELRAAQNRLQLAQDTLASRRDTAALVKSLRAAGLRTALDVTQAESQVLALEAQIPPLETAVQASARRIDTLLGQAPGTLQAELGALAPVPVPQQPAVLDAPAAVIARRPDLRRAEQDLVAATALNAAAVADLYPKLSISALAGIRDVSNNASLGIGSLAGGVLAPIFNAGRLQAEVDAAAARRQQAYFSYRQSVLVALEDVETSLVFYANADRNRQALDALVANEQDKLALARERYRRGLTPFIDVLEAQRSLFAAQTERVTVAADAARGYVALSKAVGG
jgi:NodT family efflux transporter outer membrane factor (OMF) lipoprotein